MDSCGPDFIVIGAMKSATTTLHEQLARQPGLFMSTPKEPNFFSDDAPYSRGMPWYRSLFQNAAEADIRGESSTHYTKLPTYPRVLERMTRHLPVIKLIYVMRHPVDRLLSHLMHQRSLGNFNLGLEDAVDALPELVQYGLYSMQLRPYFEAYGESNVLPVFFGRLTHHPQEELERICAFLGYPGRPCWDFNLRPQNVGKERLRPSALRDLLVQSPIVGEIRKKLLPKPWTEPVKTLWRMQYELPALDPHLLERLKRLFDPDLATLGEWLGIHLDCDNFIDVTSNCSQDWIQQRGRLRANH